MSWKTKFILIAAAVASGAPALALQAHGLDQVSEAIRKELSSRYPGARIELKEGVRWSGNAEPADLNLSTLRVIGVNPQGFAQISASDENQSFEGWIHYSASIPAYVAVRRVHPGDHLVPEMFTRQDVVVSSGSAYDFRGVILPQDQKIDGLQSRQTILEGQFLTSSSVERVPDIRRGDQVRLTVISGGLSISTQGLAEEPGFFHGRVRVLSQKTKREFTGELKSDGSVEVKL